jgi:hypothetical protein
MTQDEKEAELRSVYSEMDEDKREKMEFLAVNLLNAQKVAENEQTAAGKKQETEKN